MAKREAQARSLPSGEETPATLTSAAEEHAQALRDELLKSTELAAKKIVGQTRVEGERRIEVAGRRAQAIAETVSGDRAGRARARRPRQGVRRGVQGASRRARVVRRGAVGGRGAPATPGECRRRAGSASCRELRPRRRGAPRPPPQASASSCSRASRTRSTTWTSRPRPRPRAPRKSSTRRRRRGRTGLGRGRRASDSGTDPAVLPRDRGGGDRARRAPRAPGRRERARLVSPFLLCPGRTRRPKPEEAPAAEEEPEEEVVTRSRGRDRLYTDIGGAIIGLGGAAALINFVILK